MTQFDWLEIGGCTDATERQAITPAQMEAFIHEQIEGIRQRIHLLRTYLFFKGVRTTDGFYRLARSNRFTEEKTSLTVRVRWLEASQTPSFYWERTRLKPVSSRSAVKKLSGKSGKVVSLFPAGKRDQYQAKRPFLVLAHHIGIDRRTFSLRPSVLKKEPQWARALVLQAEKDLRYCRMAANRLTLIMASLAVMEKYLCDATKL